MAEQTKNRKRKADALSRKDVSSVTVSGRGSVTGWTTCPLCGRHSQKKYALGRGISSHLQAVHTPWKPGKMEVKKRRRMRERRREELRKQGKIPDDEAEPNEPETWEPTKEEVEKWDAKVLEIVTDLEATAAEATNGGDLGDVQIVKAGLDRSGKMSKDYRQSLPPFLQAAADGNMSALKEMISNAASVEELLATRDRHLSTAEHWAAGGGHLACLRFLLEQKRGNHSNEPLSKVRRRDGKTSLHYASRNGHLHCVQYLVEECGYSLGVASGDGTTPFHMACFGGNLDVAKYMIEKGSSSIATQANEWGCSAAHWVAMTKCSDVKLVRALCSLLQNHGVSFTATQKQGHSPLHKAAQRLNRIVIEWMFQPTAEGGAGLTEAELHDAAAPDCGGHKPSGIWKMSGGDEAFAKEIAARTREAECDKIV